MGAWTGRTFDRIVPLRFRLKGRTICFRFHHPSDSLEGLFAVSSEQSSNSGKNSEDRERRIKHECESEAASRCRQVTGGTLISRSLLMPLLAIRKWNRGKLLSCVLMRMLMSHLSERVLPSRSRPSRALFQLNGTRAREHETAQRGRVRAVRAVKSAEKRCESRIK